MDQTELVKMLEEEMLQSAQNLEFERAAQLRDKINELKGAPIIKTSGEAVVTPDGEERTVWRPKQQGRQKGNRRVAK
jgi:excinuclease UvrABC nuclease subunit